MTDVSKELESLLLDEFDAFTAVLRGESSLLEESKNETLEQLKQLSQNKNDAKRLHEIYERQTEAFLEGIRTLGNHNGSIVILMFAKCEVDTKKETESLMHLIADNCVEYANHGTLNFYLQLYLGLAGAYGLGDAEDCVKLWKALNDFICGRDAHSVILIITLKYIEVKKQEVHDRFNGFINELSDSLSSGDPQLDNFIVSMECFFPIFPDIVIPIYTAESTRIEIRKRILELEEESSLMVYLEELLRLMNASQISEECRAFNLKHYFSTLLQGWRMKNSLISVLSAVCLAKLYNLIQLDKSKLDQVSLDSLCKTLTSYICEQSTDLNIAIEGLAYISLSKTHRQLIRDDVDLVEKLVDVLGKSANSDHSLCFGVLTIFSHLSAINNGSQTSRQSTVNDLKNFASPSGVKDQAAKENVDEIYLFNKDLVMNYNIMSIIQLLRLFSNDVLSRTYSQSTKDLTITLVKQLATSKEKAVKEAMAKNGGIDLVMDYLVSRSELDKEKMTVRPKTLPDLIVHYLDGCRALSKLLIVVDPTLVFKKYEGRNAVPYVAELISEANQEWIAEKQPQVEISSLDKFEGLMALTNLATIDSTTRTLIIRLTFDPYVNNYLLADNLQVRKGAIELISNLIVEPLLLAKFFNIEGSKANYERLDLLIKLLNSEDDSIQLAVAGLLVNACDVSEMIGDVLLSDDKIRAMLLQSIISILETQADVQDLILRIAYLIQEVVYLGITVNPERNTAVLKSNTRLQTALSSVLKMNKDNKEIVSVIIQVLRMLRD